MVAPSTSWRLPPARSCRAAPRSSSPSETGVVRSIRVQDGQAVKAGDVLIESRPTTIAADRDRLRGDLLAEQLCRRPAARALARQTKMPWPICAARQRRPDPLDRGPAPAPAQPGRRASCQTGAAPPAAQKEAGWRRRRPPSTSFETIIPVIQPRVDVRRMLMEKDLG